MKAEKIQKEVPSRTLQSKPNRGRVYMKDNRSEVINQISRKGNFSFQALQMSQPLITNYIIGPDGQPLTVGHTFESHPPREYVRDHVVIEHDGHGTFTAKVDALEVGALSIYEDNNGEIWINNIEVREDLQRLGIATKLIEAAINEYGYIYASSGTNEPGGSEDTRHLEPEGFALVQGLIHKGIMEPEWYKEAEIA